MNGTVKSILAMIFISLHSGCLPAVRVGSPDWAAPAAGSGRVAVYLESGRQLEVRGAGADVASILAREGLDPGQVVAVTGIPRDKLVDGVAIGAAAGTGVALGWGYHLAEGDYSADVVGASALYGVAGGAGIGALLDAGIAKPEKPLWIRPAPGLAPSTPRRLNLAVRASALNGWLARRKVQMMLEDGTYLKGKIVGGDEREIAISISDSNIKGRKGRTETIPADQIATVVYRENIGGNRLSAAIGGGLAGLFIGPLITSAGDLDSAGVGLGVGLVGGTLTGFGLAQHNNTREVTISVIR